MIRARFLATVPFVALFVLAVVVRLDQHHAALLYPDGYQYLLMARGITEHLEPTTVLGPGGELFAPNPDAAAKPLFPIVVAAVHTLGVSWLEAARVVTAVAGAWVVIATALLVSKLSDSRVAGLLAGLVVLSSPSLGLWSGFSGPDPLAQALVLGAALAFVHGRSMLGGLLLGLAVATRPEMAALAIAAGALALGSGSSRRQLRLAAPVAVVSAALPMAIIQSPVAMPDWRLLVLAPVFALIALVIGSAPDRALLVAAAVGVALGTLALVTQVGPGEVWRADWPLLVAGGVGVAVLVRDKGSRRTAMLVLGAILTLGAVYYLKNPTLPRYFSLVLPAGAVLAGVAVASLPRPARPVAFAAVAGAALLGFVHPIPGSRDYDMFPVVAKDVAPHLAAATLVTAAPDAYGFWLPDHPVRAMRPGAEGVVLLDAAQRVYQPGLTAEGAVVTRIDEELAFARPDLAIDADPALLVRGEVIKSHRVDFLEQGETATAAASP
jgi:hypothetical protein